MLAFLPKYVKFHHLLLGEAGVRLNYYKLKDQKSNLKTKRKVQNFLALNFKFGFDFCTLIFALYSYAIALLITSWSWQNRN